MSRSDIPTRLDQLLQSQGLGTRRACQGLIARGLVSVDGVLCTEPGPLSTPPRTLTVNGVEWAVRAKVYVMLHKPAGYECSHRPQHHLSVFQLLPAPLIGRGIQCVGRLDFDTTGLLLLSDDGDFIHRYSSPKKELGKIYEVTTKHALTGQQLEALRTGVLLHGESAPIVPRACEPLAEHRLRLTIAEGKYHQVKRMLAAAGNRVEALHRTAVGPYVLPDDLAPGQWRWLELP